MRRREGAVEQTGEVEAAAGLGLFVDGGEVGLTVRSVMSRSVSYLLILSLPS